MPIPTLTQLYEEVSPKRLTQVVSVAGHLVDARNLAWSARIGEAMTCSFELDNPGPAFLLAYLQEQVSVVVWAGFDNQNQMQFNGYVESVSPSETHLSVECVGQGRKLDAPYKRTVTATDGVTTAGGLVDAILAAAGIASRFVDIGPWVPGTVVPQTLDFSSYSEAVVKLAEPFGSPWYEMPTGQIRVEFRDPIPGPASFRTYFSGILTGPVMSLPPAVTNADALPRIRAVSQQHLLTEVKNRVIVRGAQVTTTGGGGEVVTTLLEETGDASSPWIPPVDGIDQFNDLIIDNNLLDKAVDIVAVVLRYLDLYNRLFEQVDLTIDGDPQIFLGATVTVIDPSYTGINARYFVEGYQSQISENDFVTTLSLKGGRAAGSTPRLSPFCSFIWTDQFIPVPPGQDIQAGNDSSGAPVGAKLLEIVPVGTGNPDSGEGTDGQMVIITFIDTSWDPDGYIVSRAWADDDGHSGTGKYFTVAYDIAGPSSAQMTLTVTDNDGRTASQTETVNVNTFGPGSGYVTGEDFGGGVNVVPAIFVAGSADMSASGDGGVTRNDFAGGAHDVVAVADGDLLAGLFAADDGTVKKTTDYCLTLSTVLSMTGAYLAVAPDGTVWAASGSTGVFISNDAGATWRQVANNLQLGVGTVKRVFADSSGAIVGGSGGFSSGGLRRIAAVSLDGTVATIHHPFQVGSVDFMFVNGKEMFVGGASDGGMAWYTEDYLSNIWQPMSPVCVAFVPGNDPGTYYGVTGTGGRYFGTAPSLSAVSATTLIDCNDMAGEGGLQGLLLFAATDGVGHNIFKSIDGGVTVAGIWGDWPAPDDPIKIATTTVPQFEPPADLYEITAP